MHVIDNWNWELVVIGAVLATSAGSAWWQSKANARRRLLAALDAYADREMQVEQRRSQLIALRRNQ
jgi:hypothetical protein